MTSAHVQNTQWSLAYSGSMTEGYLPDHLALGFGGEYSFHDMSQWDSGALNYNLEWMTTGGSGMEMTQGDNREHFENTYGQDIAWEGSAGDFLYRFNMM